MLERGLPLKSELTSSSSVKPRMPLSSPSDAALRAALMLATVMGFSVTKVRSTTETLGLGRGLRSRPVCRPSRG